MFIYYVLKQLQSVWFDPEIELSSSICSVWVSSRVLWFLLSSKSMLAGGLDTLNCP